MTVNSYFLLLVISTGFLLWANANNFQDGQCPKKFKCMPFSQCKSVDLHSVAYPCYKDNVSMICCPNEGKLQVDVVSRGAAFPDTCGEVSLSDRIIGGTKAQIGQFPFMALLGYMQKNVPFTQFLCGGSIITKRFVLTAAHCTKLDRSLTMTTVRVGELNLSSTIDCDLPLEDEVCADPVVDVPVELVIPHEKFNTETLKNDIALVKTKEDIVFTEYVRPICLPFGKKLQAKNLENQKYMISGWGKVESVGITGSTTLQYTTVKVWNIFRCNNAVPPEVKPLQNTQLCANGDKAQDACKGDSGGPLFNLTIEGPKQSYRYYQIGIVSFGAAKACGNKELPTIYSRVDGFLNWINQKLE